MNVKPQLSYYLSHPIQYFSPLLKEMSKEFDLHVYYYSNIVLKENVDAGFGQQIKWDIPLLEGYPFTFLKNISNSKSMHNRMFDAVNPSVIKTIFKSNSPVIILNGWSYFSDLLVIFAGKLSGKKIWLRAESPLNQEMRKGGHLFPVKKFILKYFLFPFINKFLYIGTESRKFFEYYGARTSQLIYTPYAVDNCSFKKQKNQLGDTQRIKEELGLPLQTPVILYTGKYIEKKRPLDLLKAFKLLPNARYVLLMVGEGEMRGEMERYIDINNLRNVVLTGFINQSMIAKYYAIADVFVMCSGMGETWGLSVNEAMNFGLPIVVSKTCGCANDLVQHNVNGYIFDEGDVEALRSCMKKLLDDDLLRREFGIASQRIIEAFSISSIIENIKAAVE